MKTEKPVSPPDASSRPWEGRTEPDLRAKFLNSLKTVERDVSTIAEKLSRQPFGEPDLNIIG